MENEIYSGDINLTLYLKKKNGHIDNKTSVSL